VQFLAQVAWAVASGICRLSRNNRGPRSPGRHSIVLLTESRQRNVSRSRTADTRTRGASILRKNRQVLLGDDKLRESTTEADRHFGKDPDDRSIQAIETRKMNRDLAHESAGLVETASPTRHGLVSQALRVSCERTSPCVCRSVSMWSGIGEPVVCFVLISTT